MTTPSFFSKLKLYFKLNAARECIDITGAGAFSSIIIHYGWGIESVLLGIGVVAGIVIFGRLFIPSKHVKWRNLPI